MQKSPLLLAVTGVIFIFVGSAVALMIVLPDWSARGQFGDMFGAVNALFAGLAFAGLLITILLQQSALAHARKESAETMTVQRASVDRLTSQLETMQRTAYLNAFNAMLVACNTELDLYSSELQRLDSFVASSSDTVEGIRRGNQRNQFVASRQAHIDKILLARKAAGDGIHRTLQAAHLNVPAFEGLFEKSVIG